MPFNLMLLGITTWLLSKPKVARRRFMSRQNDHSQAFDDEHDSQMAW